MKNEGKNPPDRADFIFIKELDKSEVSGCSDEHCVHDDALRATMISLRENDDMIAPKRGEATHRLRSNHRLA